MQLSNFDRVFLLFLRNYEKFFMQFCLKFGNYKIRLNKFLGSQFWLVLVSLVYWIGEVFQRALGAGN